MKAILPLLVAASAVQAHASYRPAGAERFSAGLTYADVSHDVIDFDGFTLDARFRVVDNFALTFSLTDASTGALTSTKGPDTYTFDVDARRFSVGAELKVPFATSFLGFTLDFAGTKLKGSASKDLQSANGDVVDNTQVILGARYVHEFGSGISLSLGVSHAFNDITLKNGFETVYEIDNDPTTAPSLALAWAPTPSFSIQLAYSTADTLLGLPDANRTVSLTLRTNF